MARLAKLGAWRRALLVVMHADLLSVQVDLLLANTALWACCRGGDARAAWRLYVVMRSQSCRNKRPDAVSYRALLRVCADNSMWQCGVLVRLSSRCVCWPTGCETLCIRVRTL